MRCVQDTDQNHHLPILHFPDAHFDLRDLAATDVPSRDLQLFRPFALRPTVGISEKLRLLRASPSKKRFPRRCNFAQTLRVGFLVNTISLP